MQLRRVRKKRVKKSNNNDQFNAVICKHAKICWEDTDFFFRRMKIIWVWIFKCGALYIAHKKFTHFLSRVCVLLLFCSVRCPSGCCFGCHSGCFLFFRVKEHKSKHEKMPRQKNSSLFFTAASVVISFHMVSSFHSVTLNQNVPNECSFFLSFVCVRVNAHSSSLTVLS